jgi:hypothetical protein
MRNLKLEKNLTGNEKWPVLLSVFIKGIPGQADVSADNSEEENEKLIQSWKNVAVFRATAEKPVKFYAGFSNYAAVCYLEYEFETDMDFAMRIGPTDNRYLVLPKDLNDEIKLELIEVTTEDDPKYKDIVLI